MDNSYRKSPNNLTMLPILLMIVDIYFMICT